MFLDECVLLREGHSKGMSLRVFPNLCRTHEYENLPLFKQLSFIFPHFVEKKYFHGNMGTYKIGGDKIPQNTHRNKKQIVYGILRLV
jgi:hypothetical protein